MKTFTLFNFLIFLTLFSFHSLKISAQPPLFKTPAYINHFSEIAIEQMIEFKIPASVIMAQAICESNCGTSKLAKQGNNHFGIKCHVGWQGDTILNTDDEENECFRSYESARESYTDHSLFLKNRPRYASLFSIPITDYKAWCRGLKLAGYATNFHYAEELIQLIEVNKLYELDRPEALISGIYQSEKKAEQLKTGYSTEKVTLLNEKNSSWLFSDPSKIELKEQNSTKSKTEECFNSKIPESQMIQEGCPDELDIARSMNGTNDLK